MKIVLQNFFQFELSILLEAKIKKLNPYSFSSKSQKVKSKILKLKAEASISGFFKFFSYFILPFTIYF